MEKVTKAKILTSIKESYNYLHKLNLSSEITHKAYSLLPGKYSERYYQTFHDGNYQKTFIVASEERDFDISLSDGSFFQFTSRNNTDIHYSYFPVFEKELSFCDFSMEYNDEADFNVEESFEVYLTTDKESIYFCPIRYDVSQIEYKEGTHPYAHLHFGANTNIRLPCSKIIKPLAFVDFVIRNTFKEIWDNAYINDNEFKKQVEKLNKQSDFISDSFFTENEKKMLHLE